MKVLFDTNIILDVLLKRKLFYKPAYQLFRLVEISSIEGFICANSVTTIYYLSEKITDRKKTERQINNLLKLFKVAAVDKLILENAMKAKFKDYEDAVVYESGIGIKADSIVTRNPRDFKKAKIPIFTPEELLTIFKNNPRIV
ncbi:PIN domain-containing protein [Candidatus Riflebacteria bacterium]